MSDEVARPARRRISRSGDFDAVYQRGASAANRHLVVYAFDRGAGGEPARLGLSVSRKIGTAVDRNRVKRVLREQFADLAVGLRPGVDVVVIARPGIAEYVERQGSAAVGTRLGELLGRLRVSA